MNRGKTQEHYMLCWPEKDAVKAMEFFKTRFSMHSNVYTHKVREEGERKRRSTKTTTVER